MASFFDFLKNGSSHKIPVIAQPFIPACGGGGTIFAVRADMIQQHCQVKLIQCPNHFEICLIRLHDCHVNVGFRLDVRHSIAHRFEKNSADRGKVSNLDGKLCQKTVAVSSVRPLEKFIELSANFLLIVFSNVIYVRTYAHCSWCSRKQRFGNLDMFGIGCKSNRNAVLRKFAFYFLLTKKSATPKRGGWNQIFNKMNRIGSVFRFILYC